MLKIAVLTARAGLTSCLFQARTVSQFGRRVQYTSTERVVNVGSECLECLQCDFELNALCTSPLSFFPSPQGRLRHINDGANAP